MTKAVKCAAFLALAFLAGCAGGNEDSTAGQAAVLKEVRSVLKANRAQRTGQAAPFTISRALLNQQTVGSLEVTVENTDQTAYLIPAAFRDDGLHGKVAVWQTITGENVILRDGILFATRGLGRDLASSDTSAGQRAVRTNGPSGGERRMQVRNDVHGADEIVLQCESTVLGRETIEIIELRFQTRKVRETCQASYGTVTNDYWVGTRGDVLQSRQWAGPGVGYLKIRLLKK